MEPGGVGRDGEVGRVDVDDPAHVPPAGGEGGGVDDLVEEGGQLDLLEVEVDHPGVQPGEVQEVVDELGEPLGLGQGHLERGGIGLGDAVDEVLQLGAQSRDGRAQLVGDVRDEVPAGAVGLLELGGHDGEGLGQLPHLVAARGAHRTAVVPARHRLGGRGHLPQRRGHAPGEQLGGDQRGDHDQRQGQQRLDPGADAHLRQQRRDGHAHAHQDPELDLEGAEAVQRAHVEPLGDPAAGVRDGGLPASGAGPAHESEVGSCGVGIECRSVTAPSEPAAGASSSGSSGISSA